MADKRAAKGTFQSDDLKEQARELYISTDLSLRQIAEKLGLPSVNTVFRWKKSAVPAWEKDVDLANKHLADAISAAQADPPWESDEIIDRPENRGLPVRNGRKTPPPPLQQVLRQQPGDVTTRTNASNTSAIANNDSENDGSVHNCEHPVSPTKERARGARVSQRIVDSLHSEAAGEVPSLVTATPPAVVDPVARAIADEHAKSLERQLRVSARLQVLGDLVVGTLVDLFSAPRESDDFQLARLRLGVLSEKETVAGLLKAVGGLQQTALGIERKALGLDRNQDRFQGALKPGDLGPNTAMPKESKNLLEALPLGMLEELRKVTVSLERLPKGPKVGVIVEHEDPQPLRPPKEDP